MEQEREWNCLSREEYFNKAIIALFGYTFWKEKCEKLFHEVVSGSRVNDGNYGDCDSGKELMNVIREKMNEQGLAPAIKMEKASFKTRIEGMKISYSRKFSKEFPNTYDYEMTNKNKSYDYDGWKYKTEDFDKWILTYKEGTYSHYYYNELDHVLTFCLGNVRKGKKTTPKEKGFFIMVEELDLKIRSINSYRI